MLAQSDCGTKQSLSSNRFGVLGFGVLRRAQINFKYRSELESRLFCSDVIFQDLSQSCFVSCVIDLLQLLFTALDPEVREEYIADLVCSVYYDNFANAVTSLAPRVQMFSKNEFVREFERNILHGFIAGLNYHTQEYEDGLVIREEKENCTNSSYTYTQYRDSVLSMVRDILQFKLNTKATIL
ncbi:uncharacterized protein LOC111700994 [Eurytemora carolleeae]|uniref:uncharacterized protein LOC111700994 n=1 Tax=Eurytemora carolleeae TaxID=1294199 RepID=UPI000C767A24|nr:uncharacterized protein LOC111700994 [Eurytemora carolleeae]|eukprot:XP_023327866.1 uncharacterized protein LOC111700994 [Eurytemora affinis]